MPTCEPAYRISNLTKIYRRADRPANDSLCLDIPSATIFAILGPNGAGKTTLVRQMTGLLQSTSGLIYLFDIDVQAQPNKIPLLVAYFGQRLLALTAHRFEEVLIATGILRGQSLREAREQADILMSRFELTDLARKLLANVSGGERRLAALLATFMGDRRVLVLDEPTNDLDPLRRQLLWQYLRERREQDGVTIIVVSHNLPEVETVASHAVLINQGRIAACGTLGDLKRTVGDRVRIELRLKEELDADVSALAEVPGAQRTEPCVWVIPAHPNDAPNLLRYVLTHVRGSSVDDFRVVTPSLDDVYLHFTAKDVAGHENSY